jgi:transposase-like protein
MSLKVAFGVIPCPACGEPMMHHDFASTGLSLAKCKACGREWELRRKPGQEGLEIKPKTIN